MKKNYMSFVEKLRIDGKDICNVDLFTLIDEAADKIEYLAEQKLKLTRQIKKLKQKIENRRTMENE